MGLCNTEDDEVWESEIITPGGKVKEGVLRIQSEDARGFFEGVFVEQGGAPAGKKVRGRCDGRTMYFLRPIDKPRFYYEGTFSANKKKLHGSQTRLPGRGKSVRDSEEWEGTKVTRKAKS